MIAFITCNLSVCLLSHPFSDAVADGFEDEFEVAVAQVKGKFLDGTGNFCHWAHPSHDAVGAVTVGNVLDDVGFL